MRAWLLLEEEDGNRRLIEVRDVSGATVRVESPAEDSVDLYGRVASVGSYDATPREFETLVPEIGWKRIPAADAAKAEPAP